MRYGGPPRRVRFLHRPNRYLARVELLPSGEVVSAHVPNPGRMEELLEPGRTVGWAIPAAGPGRSTHFDLVVVRHRGRSVSIDSRLANRLVRRVLDRGLLPEFGGGPWEAERPWGGSRFDFGSRSRTTGGLRALLEVKSSNLRRGRDASFPDAPTVRGTRHLEHLARAARRGLRAGVLFVVQRSDVEGFRPNGELDPEFARAFRRAVHAGVRAAAYLLEVHPWGAAWGRRIPVRTDDAEGPPV